MHIYDKIEYLCGLKGVTIPEAYKAMGINKGTVSLWKSARDRGQSIDPSSKNAIKMSEYFGYPTDFFLHENSFDGWHQKEKPTGMADGLSEVQREAMDLIMQLSDEQARVFVASMKAMMGQ